MKSSMSVRDHNEEALYLQRQGIQFSRSVFVLRHTPSASTPQRLLHFKLVHMVSGFLIPAIILHPVGMWKAILSPDD